MEDDGAQRGELEQLLAVERRLEQQLDRARGEASALLTETRQSESAAGARLEEELRQETRERSDAARADLEGRVAELRRRADETVQRLDGMVGEQLEDLVDRTVHSVLASLEPAREEVP